MNDRTAMSMKRQMVSLTKPQNEFLAAEAERLGITISDVIRRIIDDWRGQWPEAQRSAPSPYEHPPLR
jgi:hypothetical protein